MVKSTQVKICLLHLLYRMFRYKEMLYRHCFQLHFRIRHQQSPRKSGRIWIEWNTSALDLCWMS